MPIAPHDATGPVNIFGCSQICISSPNTMTQEHVPDYHKGWYNDIVDPNLDIRDGYLYAAQRPGVGTRLKAGLRDRPDATQLADARRGRPPPRRARPEERVGVAPERFGCVDGLIGQ